MVDDNKQPEIRRGRVAGTPSLFRGGIRSQKRLDTLRFDPIGELVKQYNAIEVLIQHQEDMRDGRRIELTSTGKPKAYRAEVHHALYDKLINIGDKLLRYGYGRVPEVNIVEERKPQALIVNLTKKGETYIVNDDDIVQPAIDDETNDWSDNEGTNGN
jgi:hypothetical protein